MISVYYTYYLNIFSHVILSSYLQGNKNVYLEKGKKHYITNKGYSNAWESIIVCFEFNIQNIFLYCLCLH